ncbi:MAG: hypothetical protein ACLFTK_01950, partial [Anaerolineales bacterium]
IVAEADAVDDDARRAVATAIRGKIAEGSPVSAHYVHVVPRGWLIKTSSGKLARAANRDKWRAETGR